MLILNTQFVLLSFAGGADSSSYFNDVYTFDIPGFFYQLETLAPTSSIPVARKGAVSFNRNGALYIFGGNSQTAFLNGTLSKFSL